MRLKSIEIFGFKSFGKKVVIDFTGPVTAIVGPNGSGKSNIVDAVRWVLGEQRVKSLRGGKMEDVIFSGTENKKALGYAQVCITLDNSDGMFRIDYDEIAITRRLFRSGESEYLINKTKCRLRDIQLLLMDTGLSREGYSIVGQGQIESIVNNSPQERKLLIEEAVGIVKYKSGKTEAEKKLEKAAANLYRITDLISEVESRLPSLKKQAQKAEEFRVLANELRDIEVSVFVARTDMLSDSIRRQEEILSEINSTLESISHDISENETQQSGIKENITALEGELLCVTQKLTDAEREYEEIAYSLNEHKNKKAVNEGNILAVRAQVEILEQSNKELREKRTSLENELESLVAREEALKADYNAKFVRSEEIRKEYNKQLDSASTLKKSIDEENVKLFSLRGRLAEEKLKAENLRLSFTECENTLSEKTKALTDAENISRENIYISELSAVSAKMKSCEDKLGEITARGEYLRDEISRAYTSMQTKDAKLRLLRGYDESLQGYKNAVKKIDELKKNNEYYHRGIRGILGEVISCDAKYAQAVSKALGGALEYIITSDENVASRAISELKKNKWGRLTFMPVSVIRSSSVYIDEDVKKMPGYLALASEIVSCDEEFRRIVDNVLYRTVIADNLDNANKIAKRLGYKNKIVTLDGDVILSGGAMVGGVTKNEDSGILGRKAEISVLESELRDLSAKHEELIQNRVQCAEEYKSAKAESERIRGEYLSISEKYSAEELLIKNTFEKIKTLRNEILSLGEKKTMLVENILFCEEAVEELSSLIASSEEKLAGFEKDNHNENEDFSAELFASMNEVSEAKALLSDASARVAFVRSSVEETEKSVLSNENLAKEKSREAENANAENALLEEKIEKLASLLAAKGEERTHLRTSGEELRKGINSHNENSSRLNDIIRALLTDKSAVVEKAGKVQNEIDRLNMQAESLAQNMLEDYEITYQMAKEMNSTIESSMLGEALEKIGSLKEKIKKLGNINADAIEEYANERNRFEDMCAQRDDLEKSSEELRVIISDISENMLVQFRREFAVIQKEFNNVFRELFNGGEAHLVLTEPDDILNSGIDIIAQPPKTKLKNISSLSGGEKTMTAISLIFAILKIKPSPFTVLDEIDAALDDANVIRFCEYLESIKQDNQFVIITHKKKTMENCDMLYGATMNSDGITKIVSVKLTDINEKGELV